ncbi:MAG TPA: dihydrofolate reductase family protein, partial [Rhizomicrobium sp.]
GATVHSAFLAAGLADALEIFTAPITLGDKGHGAIAALGGAVAAKFTRTSRRKFAPDVLESYRRKA